MSLWNWSEQCRLCLKFPEPKNRSRKVISPQPESFHACIEAKRQALNPKQTWSGAQREDPPPSPPAPPPKKKKQAKQKNSTTPKQNGWWKNGQIPAPRKTSRPPRRPRSLGLIGCEPQRIDLRLRRSNLQHLQLEGLPRGQGHPAGARLPPAAQKPTRARVGGIFWGGFNQMWLSFCPFIGSLDTRPLDFAGSPR